MIQKGAREANELWDDLQVGFYGESVIDRLKKKEEG